MDMLLSKQPSMFLVWFALFWDMGEKKLYRAVPAILRMEAVPLCLHLFTKLPTMPNRSHGLYSGGYERPHLLTREELVCSI